MFTTFVDSCKDSTCTHLGLARSTHQAAHTSIYMHTISHVIQIDWLKLLRFMDASHALYFKMAASTSLYKISMQKILADKDFMQEMKV